MSDTALVVPRFVAVDWARIEAAQSWQSAFIVAWRVICEKVGLDFDEMTVIRPTEFRLDREDWAGCCDLLMAHGASALDRSEIAMEWVNRGPSSVRE